MGSPISSFSTRYSRMKNATNATWTFREAIEKCVLHQHDFEGIPGMNEHFRPQFVSGAFCELKYDFLGALFYYTIPSYLVVVKLAERTNCAVLRGK